MVTIIQENVSSLPLYLFVHLRQSLTHPRLALNCTGICADEDDLGFDPPASALQVLGLRLGTTRPGFV